MTDTATEGALDPSRHHPWGEPFAKFGAWFKEAEQSEPNDPNCMALATVGEDGMPTVRMVLLKDYDQRGFVFYTNYESKKGRQILGSMKAEELARQGIKNVQVICPGFPADCLETLEEIAQEGKESFIVAGGKSFRYIPALNESPLWIDALGNLALANLGGWLNPELDPDSQKQALDDAARRARAMGAKA